MGINYQKEFSEVLNDIEEIGRWVVVRHKLKEFSEYYNERAQEGVGGSKYKYDDYLIRVYSAPVRITSQISGLKVFEAGTMDFNRFIFYFDERAHLVVNQKKINILIAPNDDIYELNYYDKEMPNIVYSESEENTAENKICIKEKYKVSFVNKYSGDKGLPQYYAVIGEKNYTNE